MKIMIAVGSYAPVNPHVYANHISFFANELMALKDSGHQLSFHAYIRMPLTVFRYTAMSDAIGHGYDKLVYLDDDLQVKFTPGESVLKKMFDHHHPFVTTVVHQRQYPHLPMLFFDQGDGIAPAVDWPRDKAEEIDISHLAFVMLDVGWLKEYEKKVEHVFLEVGQGGRDDIRFCRGATNLFNVRPLVEPSIHTRHAGKEVFIDTPIFERAMQAAPKGGPELVAWLKQHGLKTFEVDNG